MTTGSVTNPATDPAPIDHVLRPAEPEDLAACAAIWRESLNHYLVPLGQPQIPGDLAAVLRLYDHLRSTDPERFLVAERVSGRVAAGGASLIDGFVAAVIRERLWYLSMLFVRPEAQGRGLGRRLLRAVMPDDQEAAGLVRATATDSVQPISNALYASVGLVPRVPILRLVGLPERDGAFLPLPPGVEAIRFEEIDGGPDGLGHSALRAELTDLDRDAAGFDRAVDHAYQLIEGRLGYLFRDRDGRPVAYGYTSEAGRVGPVAVRDAALLGPVVGHLVRDVRPRGAFGLWVPGPAGEAVVPLLRAGFRLEGLPVLLCWDRPFADFSRYIPLSPGLL